MVKNISARIEGIAPLLHHRFPTEGMGDDGKAKKATATLADYKEEAQRSLYLMDDGKPYQPASHIEAALVRAGGNYKMKGARGKSFRELCKAAVFVKPDKIPLESKGGYKVDARPVVVQRSRVVRYRPIFEDWACEFTIEVLDDNFQTATLKEIFEYAGSYVGVGDFRPKYGRFKVVKFEERK